ncbi:uncharacterized protein CcaverHIS019_0200020 [Cutaneotrichosporon cavernicola]|uniref:Uncharacterized protein n=1 Tax=Cutaneotrichosporon cavernicola TaxID=279322 RepID=A0AA48L0T5_9TREE|nr:uncharacterized protein CcaverHIS019_0200020 [Cutaneotrichosporon cavernicola]BEI88640.1 hypothetical protein CcaverHIS019_0200020 [Cutaneotrichosporon cavernicola]
MTTSYEYDDLAFLRRPLVPHDPYPRFLDPPGTALQRATAIFTGGDWARSLTVLPLVELTAEAVPDRGGYLRPPHCRNTVRWHGASDSVSSCRQLPIDTSSGVVWGPSASEGGEAPVKLAALRLARLIPRLLQDDIAEAWYRCRLAGIQNLEPETARGSDPALHCGHWMTVHDHPSLPKESDPSKLSPEAADALVRLLSLLAVAGSLALQALQVADLAAGVRTEE